MRKNLVAPHAIFFTARRPDACRRLRGHALRHERACIFLALLGALTFLFVASLCLPARALAQPAAPASPVFVPRFFDPKQRLEKIDTSTLRSIWFLTEEDFPPFHFLGPDGTLTGLDVELARMICEDLKVSCTIQARRWDTLFEALENRRGDAIIAGNAITPALRAKYGVSNPYFRSPARFLVRHDFAGEAAEPRALSGRKVATVAGSAHEAYLNAFFPGIVLSRMGNGALALESLRRGEVDAAFGDGVALAFWLNGDASAGCCRFLAGAFTESAYFGEGAGIILRKEDRLLLRAINQALARIADDQRFARLYLRYFPVGIY